MRRNHGNCQLVRVTLPGPSAWKREMKEEKAGKPGKRKARVSL
jgi:hypothetical protein